MALPAGRFLLALGEDTLDWDATFTRIDSYDSLVTSYTIDRGRQVELDRTDSSRATVEIADVDGILDPTNTTGPFYGQIEPLLQAVIQRQNPMTGDWFTRFRGWVDELDYDFDPSQKVNRLSISLVDIFSILSVIEMLPGQFGVTPPAGADYEDQVFFEDNTVQERINQILGNALGPTVAADYSVVFSGNVRLWETVMAPGETALTGIQEAAEAEFPGSPSNVYSDRHGRLVFHGRLAKFDPEGTEATATPGAWDFIRWKAGDHDAVNADPVGTAHLRRFAFNRGLSHVINQAFATPSRSFSGTPLTAEENLAQKVEDTTSIGLRGIRSWSAQDLLTKEGLLDDSDDLGETRRFAEYYVHNFAVPHDRATDCGFRAMHPDWQGATKTWELLSKIDIGDHIEITVGSPGGGGFPTEDGQGGFFVEGIHEQVNRGNPDIDDVTLTLDLSPDTVYGDNPFLYRDPAAQTDGDSGEDGSDPNDPGPLPVPDPLPEDDEEEGMVDQPFTWNGPDFTVPPHTWVTIPFTAPIFSRFSNRPPYGTVWTNVPWNDVQSARWIDPSTPRTLTVPHDMLFLTAFNWMQVYLRLEHPAVENVTSYRGLRIFETTHQKTLIQAFAFRGDAGGGVGGLDVFIGDGTDIVLFASGDTGGTESGLHDGMMVMPDANLGWLNVGGSWLPQDHLGRPILKKGMRLVPQVWHDASVPLTFSCAGVAPYRPHFVMLSYADPAWGVPWSDWADYTG